MRWPIHGLNREELTAALQAESRQKPQSSFEQTSGTMGQEASRSEELDLAQIQELCLIFMKECPSGALHLHEFKRIFGVQSSSAEESLYIETVFRSFDTNQVKKRALSQQKHSLMVRADSESRSHRTTRWTSWSTWQRFTWSCGGIWKIDSSGRSRCTTRTETASWTDRRSSGSYGWDGTLLHIKVEKLAVFLAHVSNDLKTPGFITDVPSGQITSGRSDRD